MRRSQSASSRPLHTELLCSLSGFETASRDELPSRRTCFLRIPSSKKTKKTPFLLRFLKENVQNRRSSADLLWQIKHGCSSGRGAEGGERRRAASGVSAELLLPSGNTRCVKSDFRHLQLKLRCTSFPSV